MQMEDLLPDQAAAFLDSASYIEPTIDMGEKAVHFGIDSVGREFIMIASTVSNIAKVGFL